VVLKPLGPLRVRMLPVLASKVLVSKWPKALVVLIGNLPSAEYREQHTGFDGRKINNDTYYDNLGRVQRASLPYFVDEQSYFVTTQYDAII
jgi:hypothetical protein